MTMPGFSTDFEAQGFVTVPKLLSSMEVEGLQNALKSANAVAAGDRRMLDHRWCRDLVPTVLQRLNDRNLVAGGFTAVLCTYFEKSGGTNWGVAPHKDKCVPLSSLFEKDGWSNWTHKQGIPHVQPPAAVMNKMFAVRIHLDQNNQENGALLVSSGSHKTDSVHTPDRIISGNPGDALMMSPLLTHASRKSISAHPRRVLHYLFGPKTMDTPVGWYYAV